MQQVFVYRYEPPPEPTLTTLLVRFGVNAAGLFLADALVPGIVIAGWQSLLAGTAIFALVNMLLRPVALFLSCCLVVVTFGLFALVVNALMLEVAAWAAGQLGLDFQVATFWDALLGAIVISVVSLLAQLVTGNARASRG